MQSNSIGELAKALAQAQTRISCPPRNRTVQVRTRTGDKYEFSYTTLDAVIEAVREPLTSNGLWFSQMLDQNGSGEYLLRTALFHSSGEWISGDLPIMMEGEGIQKFGSAITYMRRYALTCILGIAAEEDDDANAAAGNEAKVVRNSKPANDNTKPPTLPIEWQWGTEPQEILEAPDNDISWCQYFLSAIRKSDNAEPWIVCNKQRLDLIESRAPQIYARLVAQIGKRESELEASQQKTKAGDAPHQHLSPQKPAADSLIELEAAYKATSSQKELNAVYASNEADIRQRGDEYKDAAVQLFLKNEKRLKKAA